MRYVVETSLSDFEAWSGGLRVLNELRLHKEAYKFIENYLDEYEECSDCMLTETDMNDFLWFDALYVLEENGFYNSETGFYSDDEGFEENEEG